MIKERFEFKQKTKLIIARRSGYRCAHPECDGRTTVGPAKPARQIRGHRQGQSHLRGVQARAARPGQPFPKMLRSVANGIWLCAKHADQVDTNDGKDYPPPVLLGWKRPAPVSTISRSGASTL
jgi:hypothetical protein